MNVRTFEYPVKCFRSKNLVRIPEYEIVEIYTYLQVPIYGKFNLYIAYVVDIQSSSYMVLEGVWLRSTV